MRIPVGVWRGLSFVTTVGLCLVSARAHAAPPTSLVYSRTPDAAACPDEAALRRAVATRLGSEAFTTTDVARRSVEVSISRSERGYRATVRTRLKDGPPSAERTLDAGDRCDELIEAVALAISVALDPSAFDEPSAPPEPAVPSEAPPTPSVSERPAPIDFSVGLGAALGLGEAPAPAFSGALYGAVRHTWLGAVLEVRRSLEASGETDHGTVSTTSTAFLGGPCAHVAFAFGCAVAELGFVTARIGDDPREDSTAFPRFGARLGVALPFAEDRLEARASFDALGLPGQLRVARGDATVYELPAGRVGIGVGLGLRF